MATPPENIGADDITNIEQIFMDGEVLGPEVAEPEFVTSKQLKDEEEKGRNENKDGLQKLKSTLIISGVVVAVIGAIFAIAKKIKEA